MSKYIIVSKSGKGNKPGKEYVINYQVNTDAVIYKCTLYCFGKEGRIGKYAFIEGWTYPQIETTEDKNDFIEELKAFQKGSSYRKTHPLNEDELMKLQKMKNEYLAKVSDIDNQIADIKTKNLQNNINNYRKNIDTKSLNCFQDKLFKLLINSNYTLAKCDVIIPGRSDLVIIDKKSNLPVKIIDIYSDTIDFEDLSDYEISKLL